MTESARPGSGGVGRFVDYIFGRNTLIGLASLMLLLISGYATWHGMRDFIIGLSSSAAAADAGRLSISNDFLVAVVVIALIFLMWLTLRETFGARRMLRERLITLPLYIFLAIWSVGFGYGFWWSLIAGEEATRTGLAGIQEDARDAGSIVAARIDAVRAALNNVVTWSDSQMSREDTSGGSCGVSSGAGQGPLYNARRNVRDQIISLRDGLTNSWFQPVQADLERLRGSVATLEGATIEERQKAFEARATEIRGRARSIAARSNEFGKATAAEMSAIATTVSVAPGLPGFSCYDPTLAQRLNQAARQAEQPAVLNLRDAAFNEGPAGVANAIKGLWSNIGALCFAHLEPACVGQSIGDAGGTALGARPHRTACDDRRRSRPARARRAQSAGRGAGATVGCLGAGRNGHPDARGGAAAQCGDRHSDRRCTKCGPHMGAPSFHTPPRALLLRHPESGELQR